MNNLINTGNLIQKFLPKQADIDRILKVIQRTVLKGTHLQVEIKEIQARYLNSSHFKDIYLYLSQNKLLTSRTGIRKVEMPAERYILLDSLLLKITPEKESAVLAVPETCINKIINLYHSSLFAGHQGIIKTYLTISNKFFIPNVIHYLRSYRMPHLSFSVQWEATSKAASNQNKSTLHSIVKIEHGFKSHAKIT